MNFKKPVRSSGFRGSRRLLGAASTLALAAIAMPGAAFAQDGQEATESDNEGDETPVYDNEIVVTGTLIRGIAPTGASPVAVSDEDVQATGATSTAQLLETIPQLGSFGTLQQPVAQSQEVSVNRPNLRQIPGFNTAGGSTTLVLLNGQRIVGMGNASTTPDPDIIPPGVLQRLEIVPDGGSAIYGSDAVAGVMNFITIKRFDGLKVDGSYGFADDYYRYDASATGGYDWGSGSAFLSYNYAKSDDILGRDRDYIQQFPDSNTGLLTIECDPGNIQALAGVFGRPAGTVVGANGGPVTQCDESDYATVVPKSRRHSVFGGVTQDLTPGVTLEVTGFYTNRKTRILSGPFRGSQILSPFPIPGVPSVQSPFAGFGSPNLIDIVQQASFAFGDNDSLETNVELDVWGVAPSIEADIGGGYRLRVQASYGESQSDFRGRALNDLAIGNAIQSGAFNPFDPASSDPAAIAAVTNYQQFGDTKQTLFNVRAIVDGDLFELPAGPVKIAAGVEYSDEGFTTQNGATVPGAEDTGFAGNAIIPAIDPLPRFDVGRDVKSVFGEVVIPVIATASGVELDISASGRYDDYSDFGDTFNPRFGATFRPTDWISIFGAWGESFNAPSLADFENSAPRTVFVLSGASAAFFAPPQDLVDDGTYPAYDGGLVVAARGNAADIQPQEAETWTIGFDVQPPFVEGLNFGVTYYNISLENLIGLAPFQTPAELYRDFGNLINLNPTQAELDALIADADIINGGITNPLATSTFALFNARKDNLGRLRTDGLDLRFSYDRPTDFGSVFLNSQGTYLLSLERSNTADSPFFETIDNNFSRLKLRTTLGANYGPVLGQVTWNHQQGYDLDPALGFVPQTSVDQFNTFDLFVRYEVPGEGIGKDLSFTFNINNMFDAAPPEYRGQVFVPGIRGIPALQQTLGRLVQFGVSKRF